MASVAEGGVTGHEVIASPDGRLAYVPIYGNSGVGKPGTDGNNIVVIDLSANKVVGNVGFDHGVRPHDPVFGPKDGMLYVTTELDKTVTVIDPKTLKIVGTIPTGQAESHMLVISHDGRRGYTANVGPGTVSVLDLHRRTTVMRSFRSRVTRRGWRFRMTTVAVLHSRPDAAADGRDRYGDKQRVSTWVSLDGMGYGSAVTPDNRWLLMALPDQNEVAVIDLKRRKVARTIAGGAYPQEVLMQPHSKMAYVSCMHSGPSGGDRHRDSGR